MTSTPFLLEPRYTQSMHEVVFNWEMLHVTNTREEADEHYKNIRQSRIRAQEIQKRFEKLLGTEYQDLYPTQPKDKMMKEILDEVKASA